MKNLMGIFLVLMFLNGCAVMPAPGSRTEYEDKSKEIDKDYKDNKITKDESIKLKDQASQKGKNVEQKNEPIGAE